ncbi:MAG TPA: MAB_1171c family putative transporter [Actinocrinis sp.]
MNETSPFFPVIDVCYSVIAASAYAAVAYKIWTWRHDLRNGVLWMLCIMLAAPGSAFLIAVPPVYAHIDAFFGVPSLSTLLLYSAVGAGFGGAFRAWVRTISDPELSIGRREVRGIATQCGSIVAGMALLFALGSHPYERPIDFDLHYARQPATAAFLLLFNLAFGHRLLTSAWRSLRASRQPVTAEQARSLRLVAFGAFATTGYVLGSLVALAGRWARIDLDPARTVVAPAFASIGAILILSGSSGPTLARRARAARVWTEYVRGYWMLRGLWARLDALVLLPGAQGRGDAGRLAARELTHRLYRRTTALRDAQEIIAGTIDTGLARIAARRAAAAGMGDEQTAILLHAAALAVALRENENESARPGRPKKSAPQSRAGRTRLPVPGVRDLDGELRWQLAVRRLLGSRLLAAVLEEHRREPGLAAAPATA